MVASVSTTTRRLYVSSINVHPMSVSWVWPRFQMWYPARICDKSTATGFFLRARRHHTLSFRATASYAAPANVRSAMPPALGRTLSSAVSEKWRIFRERAKLCQMVACRSNLAGRICHDHRPRLGEHLNEISRLDAPTRGASSHRQVWTCVYETGYPSCSRIVCQSRDSLSTNEGSRRPWPLPTVWCVITTVFPADIYDR
jgi:hypothetical protein